MAFRIDYTPVGAVGELAAAAGRAQQQVREQAMAEARGSQARAFAQQSAMQANQLEAQRLSQDTQLAFGREQLAAQNAQANANRVIQREAAEKARAFQAQRAAQADVIQERQFGFQEEQAAQKFALTSAAASREEQRISSYIKQQESQTMLQDEAMYNKISAMRSNLANWQGMKEELDPAEYNAGLISIRQGRQPRMPEKITPYQEASLKMQEERYGAMEAKEAERTQAKIKEQEDKIVRQERATAVKERTAQTRRLSSNEAKQAGQVATNMLPETSWYVPGDHMSVGELKDQYSNYMDVIGYNGMSITERRQADTIYDQTAKTAGQGNWEPEKIPEVYGLRNSAYGATPAAAIESAKWESGGTVMTADMIKQAFAPTP